MIVPLFAFGMSLLLHAAALWVFPRIGLLDFPGRYGLSRARIPYPTGLITVVLFLSLTPLLFTPRPETTATLWSILLLGIVCLIDDRRPLPSWLRLAVHLLIGFMLFLGAVRIYSFTNPFAHDGVIPLDRVLVQSSLFGSLPVLSGIFTIVWILLTINALNWFDGITGQVSVLATIAFLVIGFLSLSDRVNQPEVAAIALTLAGLALAGACFDFPPARVLMGDTGAMFYGLMIGILTIYAGGKVATAFLVLGVPLIDFLFVIIRRLARGQSPLRGNTHDEHLHHRLLAKGWSPRQIVLLTAGLGSAFGITALFLSTFGKFIAAGLLFLVMLFLSWYSRPPCTTSSSTHR